MKYGIMTFHNIPNFGAMMQAYSLCRSIRQLGYDCEIIDYSCENIIKRERVFHPTNSIIKSLILKVLIWPKTKRKIRACDTYMKNQGIISSYPFNRETINMANSQYDAFISGADMIWNLDVTGHDLSYFLNFVENDKPMFSYGSSVGNKWSMEDVEKIEPLLKRYTLLSVREEDTCNFISDSLKVPCKMVADPTMLLTEEEWISMAKEPNEKGYVLVYFPRKDIVNAAKKYAQNNNKKVIIFNWNLPNKGVSNIAPNTPPEWLGYFYNADAIFTNSYHGLLFSLYFKKQVWTANYGNRLMSLIEKLSLENCLLKNDVECKTRIDYTECSPKIEKIRQESVKYLRYMLSYCDNGGEKCVTR